MAPDTIREPRDGFFVWTKKGRAPRFHHVALESAQAEADRLAIHNPGAKYIVMAGVSKHSVRLPSAAGSERPAGEAEPFPAGQSREAA